MNGVDNSLPDEFGKAGPYTSDAKSFCAKDPHIRPGVIKLPILVGIYQCKCMVILEDFPYKVCLVGNMMTPARSLASCIACIYPGAIHFRTPGCFIPRLERLVELEVDSVDVVNGKGKHGFSLGFLGSR